MAVQEKKAADDGKAGESFKADSKADSTGIGRPASQGDNPADRHDAEGVIPAGLESAEVYAPPAPGVDPDSVIRAAKHSLASADPSVNDHADRQVEDAAKARRLIAERNRTVDPKRVEAIDSELASLGFDAKLATTEVQRGTEGPVGRRSPGTTKA